MHCCSLSSGFICNSAQQLSFKLLHWSGTLKEKSLKGLCGLKRKCLETTTLSQTFFSQEDGKRKSVCVCRRSDKPSKPACTPPIEERVCVCILIHLCVHSGVGHMPYFSQA